ncbi:hypothetical protein MPDQ_004728 [Monascus purpureus]|uniref:Sas10 C-terminal domain-containing protein n=1 Tax=Monascus purpureus TaxID=5098 RepID=A0A507QL71_MONPU|nr:hypothetical protein MPDQ_004728 [Monascus purpureus]BDD54684.1 hypothetical protein MAP00_000282 [Monascus purpureus]
MGRKRKAAGSSATGGPVNKNSDFDRSKFDIEETFADSEDEFQAGRDQILLDEGPEAKRQRKLAQQDEDLLPSDEEILGYESIDEDDLVDDDEDDVEVDDAYENDLGEIPKKSRSVRRDSSPTSEAGDEEEEEDEGIAAWGTSRKDLYNADQIETEVDALEEEAEAKRLQQKHLEAMEEEDFGFDETEWMESGKRQEDEEAETGVVTEVLPQMEIPEDMSKDEKLKVLRSRYPEVEPLSNDFIDLQPTYQDLVHAAKAAESRMDKEDLSGPAPTAVMKFRALSAYLGAISMYFMLLSSPSQDSQDKPLPMPPAQLRGHPVMSSLVKFRKLWNKVKDIDIPEISSVDDTAKKSEKDNTREANLTPSKNDKRANKIQEPKESEQKKKKKKKKKKKTKAQRAAEAEQREAEARRAERLRETEAGLEDLSNLVAESGRKRKVQKANNTSARDADDSDFGDEDLTVREAEEKAKQKRSLRFYTSQLAQKANKRSAAGRDAGGDADIPYRERLRDRQARLNAEAEKRGKQRPDKSEELGGDSDEEDHRTAGELRGDNGKAGSDSDDYYDMVAARSRKRKDEKKARREAYEAAAREGGHVEIQEEIGPDGKRAITYQIEKNKGLTPKRSKDSRNPRVKKRKKYDEKMKKLPSMRAVYKGGEGRGGYGGELTGIKKNLVKSVKL